MKYLDDIVYTRTKTYSYTTIKHDDNYYVYTGIPDLDDSDTEIVDFDSCGNAVYLPLAQNKWGNCFRSKYSKTSLIGNHFS